jgi:hypothetical protein
MNNLIIKRSQLVEAQFTGTPAVTKRYAFTEIPNLSRNNIILYGFEALTAGQMSATPLGNTVIADADQPKVVVTLKDNDNLEFVYQFPLYSLVRSNNAGLVTLLEPRILNLTDCYVQLVDATGISTNEVAAFNFYYDLID